MTVQTLPQGFGAAVASEAAGTLSRETITVASGAGALADGTVLGRITASGKYVAYDPAGTDDGRRTAAAVLMGAVDATSADVTAVATVRLAEVWADRLAWASGVNSGQKTTGLGHLATAFVIAR